MKPQITQAPQEQQIFNQWIRDRNTYALVKYLFDIELTPLQRYIVRLIAFDEHKRVIIICMTRYGKSFCVSLGLLLWILFHPNKKLAIVAPTHDKTTIIRNHMANFIARSKLFIDLLDGSRSGLDRIRQEVSKKRMTWKNGVEMRTLTAEGEGAALMGFGADKLVVDETGYIPHEVFRSKILRMLGDNPDSTYVEIGNPIHRDNQMWAHWIDPEYLKVHIGYEIALTEGRISQEFVDEVRAEITDREFQILYEARFPEDSEDQLIPYSWIQRAIRATPVQLQGEKRLGGDIARMGNDSTVLTYGYKTPEGIYAVTGIKDWNKEDTMQTVGRTIGLHSTEKFMRMCIDANGLGGGVVDRLMELKRTDPTLTSVRIVPFMSGESPSNDDAKARFLNTKAEAYFHLRGLFEHNQIIIPNHKKLIEQLSKMKWKPSSNSGKIKILDPGEAEEDTSEEKSPDFADSLCYFAWDSAKPALVFERMHF